MIQFFSLKIFKAYKIVEYKFGLAESGGEELKKNEGFAFPPFEGGK
jgi:hypothetical protein